MVRRERLYRRQPRAAVAQVTVGIVFEKQRIVTMEDLGYLLAPGQGKRSAGRVLEGGHEIDELHRPGSENPVERIGNEAVVVGFQLGIGRFVGIKCLECAEVGGASTATTSPGEIRSLPIGRALPRSR